MQGKGGWFRQMILIGSLLRVVQRNKSHLFTVWISALKLPITESGYTSVKTPSWVPVETHNMTLKLICAEVVPNWTTLPRVLLELLCYAALHVREKRKTCNDRSYYCTFVLQHISSCFVEVTDPSSSRWHTGKELFLECVENSIEFDSAGCIPGSSQLASRNSWIYMLWFDQIGILAYHHASALTIALACSLHKQELKVIHTGTLHKLTPKWALTCPESLVIDHLFCCCCCFIIHA